MSTCTNIVVTIELNSPFKLLMANFSHAPKRFVSNQTIAPVLPHPLFVVATHIKTAEVLGIVQDEG